MTQVSVKKRRVIHRRRDPGSWGPRRRGRVTGGEDVAGAVGDPGEEGATGADGGGGASRARRWLTRTGWAKCAGGAGVRGADPGPVSCAEAGPEGDTSGPEQGRGPGVSRTTGSGTVPAGNTGKGGSTTGSVGNTEERSSSEVEAGVVVVVEKGKTDSSNTTWRDEDLTRGKVVASVPLVIQGVSKEDTESRTGS